MWTTLFFAIAALLAAVTTPSACNPTYQETGDCEVSFMLSHYVASSYVASQSCGAVGVFYYSYNSIRDSIYVLSPETL